MSVVSLTPFASVFYTGNTSAVSDSEFEDAFLLGDAGLTRTLCSPVVGSVTLRRRLGRRRLQTGSGSTTLEYQVISDQTNTSAMYQSEDDANAFLNSNNDHPAMRDNGVVGKLLFESSSTGSFVGRHTHHRLSS